MTIPAAGEALKGLLGRQEASTSVVHLDYLNNRHKKTHLIEWMWEDNQHNKTNGVLKQCQMMSPGSQPDPCLSTGLHVLFHLLSTLFMLQFQPLRSTFFFKFTHTHTEWEGAVSEWALILPIWTAYQCNFSKHTSQIPLMPSKTPGGTLAYTSVYTLHW